MAKLNEYLTVKEAAECLGVSPNTVRNWGREGRITEHRHAVNNYRLYRRDQLEQLLAATAQSSLVKPKPR